jgi:hypothetical protein
MIVGTELLEFCQQDRVIGTHLQTALCHRLREHHKASGERGRPSRAAIFTKSGSELAFIFCIILP